MSCKCLAWVVALLFVFPAASYESKSASSTQLKRALSKTRREHVAATRTLAQLVTGQSQSLQFVLGPDGRVGDGRRLHVLEPNPDALVIDSNERQLKKRKYGGKAKGKKKKNRGKMKGKGKMTNGKGGNSMGMKAKGGGKGKSKYNNGICDSLGLGASSHPVSVFGKGKGKGRQRELQRGGQNCSPNAHDMISSNPDLSIFLKLLQATGLEEVLSCEGPLTVLAPSNQSFEKNPDLLRSLFNPRNSAIVRDMLLHHFIPDYTLEDDFFPGPIDSLLETSIDVKTNPLMFDQAGVSEADLTTCNAVVHIINDPLIPKDSAILPEICEILDFRRPSQFPGSGRLSIFNNRRLFDLELHGSLDDRRRLQYTGDRCKNDVLDYIKEDPDLSTFEDLLDEADLEDIFLCAGPFTVLAPTNEAFAAMDQTLLAQLREPEHQELLQEVLLYHLLPEYQPSRSFVAGSTETMLFDNNINVQLDPLRFDGAGIVNPDNVACNGVVHTIDDVLVPGQDNCDDLTFDNRRRLQDVDCDTNILETARDLDELSTVVSLIETAGLDYIFDCPGPFTALLPNNDAFDKLSESDLEFLQNPDNVAALEELLLYHILPNSTLTEDFMPGPTTTLSEYDVEVRLFPLRFDDAAVVTPDIDACEGLIDIIDTVLSPFPFPTVPPSPSPTIAPTPEDICDLYTFNRRTRMLQNGGAGCTSNVFATAQENDDLEIITELISFAGLEPIFDCAGPFTALLPTNTAMQALENDRPNFLQTLATDSSALRDFLLYHILPGAQQTSDFTAGPTDTLLADSQVEVTLDPLEFDGFGVETGDIQACNGYVHVIGGILESDATMAPTVPPPSQAPVTATPTTTPVQRLRIRDFYISFANANAERSPTDAEFEEMMERTNTWFSDAFAAFYADDPDVDFLGSTSVIDETRYGDNAGIPESRFNMYIGFNFTDLVYSIDSTIPETEETFDLLEAQITTEYIVQVVRTYIDTPFALVNEVWFAASESDVPVP